MVTEDGFIRNANGDYVDCSDETILEIHVLEHSKYGTIKYVEYAGTQIPVEFDSSIPTPTLPTDWKEEL